MDEGFCVIEFLDGPHGPMSDYVHVMTDPAYLDNAGIPDVVGQRVRDMVPAEAASRRRWPTAFGPRTPCSRLRSWRPSGSSRGAWRTTQIIDGGMPAAGLIAHTLVSHFVDHLPYYRLEAINARSGVHTPRSTLASWSGRGGAALIPLVDALKRFVLSCVVLQAERRRWPC